MKIILKTSILLFYIINNIYSDTCFAQKTESSEKLNDIHIYDYEKIFTNEEIMILSGIIAKYKKQTNNEILLATSHSIGDFSSIQEYATYLGSTYSNDIKNENIVTVVVSNKLKEIAIATSPVAREHLTDEMSADIIKREIIPKIKDGSLFEGIKQGICHIVKILNKE